MYLQKLSIGFAGNVRFLLSFEVQENGIPNEIRNHPSLKRNYLLLVCLTLAINLWLDAGAQVHYRFFYGKVLDVSGKNPLSNVNISFEGSKMGSVSDQKGSFSFYIDTIPVYMIVSHLGYRTKRILLDGNNNSMVLYMDPEIRELKEVEIKANRVEPYFRDQQYTLRDYEIDSGFIYLLVYRNRASREELICKNPNGDTVARSGILSFTPTALATDCIGYLHVLGKDSVYQVYRQDDSLRMIHPDKLEKYLDILSNCVAATDRVLFFKKITNLGQGAEYYGINRISREKKVLSKIMDEDKAKMLRRNPQDAGQLRADLPGGHSLDVGREDFDNWNWVHKILYRPVKTALYKVGNFICIFDIPGKQLEFYDPDGNFSLKLKINIEAIKEGKWSGEIYLDESQSKIYTTFLKSSGTGVYRLDLNTGDLKKILSLRHPYPQKIKISQGWIYYMYDIHNDPENKALFRQEL